MRKMKALCFVMLAGLAISSSAQSIQSSGKTIWRTVKTDSYNRVYISYTGAKGTIEGLTPEFNFPGFSAGYLRGIGLTPKFPFYLEVGGAFQFNRYSEKLLDYSESVNMLGVNVPVSVVYRVNVTDNFAISPNFGLNFRLNLFGKMKMSDETASIDMNVFSDNEMAELGGAWKRFQAGWHIGVGFDYKALHLGVDYGTDFNEIAANTKAKTTWVTLGMNF